MPRTCVRDVVVESFESATLASAEILVTTLIFATTWVGVKAAYVLWEKKKMEKTDAMVDSNI
jgi:hypothetical protein